MKKNFILLLLLTFGLLAKAQITINIDKPVADTSVLEGKDVVIEASTTGSVDSVVFLSNRVGDLTDQSIAFDGNYYIESENYYGPTGDGPFTIEAWILVPPNASNEGVIMQFGHETTNGGRIIVRCGDNLSGGIVLRMEVGGGFHLGNTIINDSSWHHIAVVVEDVNGDGTTNVNESKLYINGVLEVGTSPSDRAIDVSNGANKLNIGRRPEHNDRYFQGNITEVRLWDTAMTATSIKKNMNSRLVGDEAGLILYYPLSGGGSNPLYDASSTTDTAYFRNSDGDPLDLYTSWTDGPFMLSLDLLASETKVSPEAYSIVFNSTINGSYFVYAQAYGLLDTFEIASGKHIEVENVAPELSILLPTQDTSGIANDTVVFLLDIVTFGSITDVKFYEDDTEVTVVTVDENTYKYVLKVGTLDVYAKAWDDQGDVGISDTITITVLNNNVDLDTLYTSDATPLSPLFDPSILIYTDTLVAGTDEVPTITAVASDSNATVEMVEALTLNDTTTIQVTAEDSVTKGAIYKVAFYVKPTTTGIRDISTQEYRVYPNPATDYVFIDNYNGTYQLFDLSGRSILNGRVNNGMIDLSTIKKGSYLLSIGNGNSTLVIIK